MVESLIAALSAGQPLSAASAGRILPATVVTAMETSAQRGDLRRHPPGVVPDVSTAGRAAHRRRPGHPHPDPPPVRGCRRRWVDGRHVRAAPECSQHALMPWQRIAINQLPSSASARFSRVAPGRRRRADRIDRRHRLRNPRLRARYSRRLVFILFGGLAAGSIPPSQAGPGRRNPLFPRTRRLARGVRAFLGRRRRTHHSRSRLRHRSLRARHRSARSLRPGISGDPAHGLVRRQSRRATP